MRNLTLAGGDVDDISLQLDALMASDERRAQYLALFGEHYQTMADCAMLLDSPTIARLTPECAARSVLTTIGI